MNSCLADDTQARPNAAMAPDLIHRNFDVSRARPHVNRRHTYITTWSGFLYLNRPGFGGGSGLPLV
jgi:hypothetical protein